MADVFCILGIRLKYIKGEGGGGGGYADRDYNNLISIKLSKQAIKKYLVELTARHDVGAKLAPKRVVLKINRTTRLSLFLSLFKSGLHGGQIAIASLVGGSKGN